jgi:hypothetical protein
MEEIEKESHYYSCNRPSPSSEQEHNILECMLNLQQDIDIVLGLSYVQNSIELVVRWSF